MIFLTTLIGAGQGLFVALFAAELGALFELLPAPRARWFYVCGSLIALALTGAGLVSSFFHLGRPERAWRSAAQWRTSWLSREVIVLPVFMGIVAAVRASRIFPVAETSPRCPGRRGRRDDRAGRRRDLLRLRAVRLHGHDLRLPAVPAGMAHAAHRRQLHRSSAARPGSRSRPRFSTALRARARRLLRGLRAGIFTLLGFVGRAASLGATRGCARSRRCRPRSASSTRGSCRRRRVRWAARSTRASSSTAARRGRCARSGGSSSLALFALPLLLFAAGLAGAPAVIGAAFAVQYAGLLAERWFFFAQANHPQNLYYQAIG